MDVEDFIKEHAKLLPVPFVPEITLYQAEKMNPVWRAMEVFVGQRDVSMPFWSFVWAGGQAMARYILDHPEIVQGQRVLDFASGSGVGAIAAVKAGAKKVWATDIDPVACIAMELNAAHNGTSLEDVARLDMGRLGKKIDLIITGDVCYEHTMSHRVMRWLRLCRQDGIRVIISDPARGYAPDRNPDERLTELATYTVPTSREVEERDTRDVTIWNCD